MVFQKFILGGNNFYDISIRVIFVQVLGDVAIFL